MRKRKAINYTQPSCVQKSHWFWYISVASPFCWPTGSKMSAATNWSTALSAASNKHRVSFSSLILDTPCWHYGKIQGTRQHLPSTANLHIKYFSFDRNTLLFLENNICIPFGHIHIVYTRHYGNINIPPSLHINIKNVILHHKMKLCLHSYPRMFLRVEYSPPEAMACSCLWSHMYPLVSG